MFSAIIFILLPRYIRYISYSSSSPHSPTHSHSPSLSRQSRCADILFSFSSQLSSSSPPIGSFTPSFKQRHKWKVTVETTQPHFSNKCFQRFDSLLLLLTAQLMINICQHIDLRMISNINLSFCYNYLATYFLPSASFPPSFKHFETTKARVCTMQ